MTLQLKKFDMKNIADDKVVVFIGKRETGKSILVKDLLYYHQYYKIGILNQHYKKVKKNYILNKF